MVIPTRIKIIGAGGYLPDKIVSNFDLEKIVDTSDEWITKRTGIHNRHIASQNQFTSDLAVEAINNAVKNANINIDDIDMIICATTTPDLTFPSTACIIQKKLGIKKTIIAFDIQAVCSGFIYALSVGSDMMKCRNNIKNAIIVGSEKMSSIIDWSDRSTCVLFGDGAGAVVLNSDSSEDNSSFIIDTDIYADGNFYDILHTSGGVSNGNNDSKLQDFEGNIVNRTAGIIKMDGKNVFQHAVEKMVSSINNILNKNNYTINDIKLIIPHQANYRILSLVGKRLGISDDKFMLTIDKHANTSSASIPLALDVALKEGKAKKGDLVILEALGAGLTWGSALVRL